MAEWKDTTSYAQGDRARGRQPDCWTLKEGQISIAVLSGHLYYPGEWVMHCYALGIKEYQLGLPADQPKELAQQMALTIAAKRADQIAATIRRLKVAGGDNEPCT